MKPTSLKQGRGAYFNCWGGLVYVGVVEVITNTYGCDKWGIFSTALVRLSINKEMKYRRIGWCIWFQAQMTWCIFALFEMSIVPYPHLTILQQGTKLCTWRWWEHHHINYTYSHSCSWYNLVFGCHTSLQLHVNALDHFCHVKGLIVSIVGIKVMIFHTFPAICWQFFCIIVRDYS